MTSSSTSELLTILMLSRENVSVTESFQRAFSATHRKIANQ